LVFFSRKELLAFSNDTFHSDALGKRKRRMKRWSILVVGGIAVAGFFGYRFVHQNFTVHIPTYPAPAKTVWLDQNWTEAQRSWFHAADQGTLTFGIPYEWLVALEQPEITLAEAPPLTDTAYLDRFGFIPTGPGQLPVGFARGGPMPQPDGTPWLNPQTNAPLAGVGLTCAACHTGRFTYQGTQVFVDGAPALTNLDTFRTSLGLSLVFTKFLPGRYDRFAARVLGPHPNAEAQKTFQAQFDAVLARVNGQHTLDNNVQKQSVAEGFGRLDALNRIGNTVFALDLQKPENYVGTSAPVHFPRIWNASWFDWVQYNGSIEQPMVRNVGEAMGVSAWVDFAIGTPGLYASSVRVDEIYKLEQLLAGKQPDAQNGFSGLRPPKWPENILPPIDKARAAQGAALYKQLCQSCHLPSVDSAEFWASPKWKAPNAAGERYLEVELVDISHIGTDPAQAVDMKNRKLVLPAGMDLGSIEFGPALGTIVENVVTHWYDSQTPKTPDARPDEWPSCEWDTGAASLQGAPVEWDLGDAALSA
jgi:mono/diheme cytochrome c family protein